MLKQLIDIHATAAGQKMEECIARRTSLTMTGVTESHSIWLSALNARPDRRILMLFANDLKAAKAAEDAQQIIGTQAACLPGGEISLTRGASSHESSWRRLETLTRVSDGEVTLLCASMDAAMQRMGSADTFRANILRLEPGDCIEPLDMIELLVHMGYERVDMVEGKGQCALRGAILDCFPPSSPLGLRIEFYDDEVDGIRTFDCISQRSLEQQLRAVIPPACETLFAPEACAQAAQRMREALREAAQEPEQQENLFDELPPLPEDDDELPSFFDEEIAPKVQKRQRDANREAEIERRTGYLLQDADLLESGVPFKRIRAWLPVLTDDMHTLLDWYDADCVVLMQPDQLRDRCEERLNGFGEELQSAMQRGEAVVGQQSLLYDWETVLSGVQKLPHIAVTEFLRGMGGVKTELVLNMDATGVSGYQGQPKLLAEDCRRWLDDGYTVALLTGGVARGNRLCESLKEVSLKPQLVESAGAMQAGSKLMIMPVTLSRGFIWPEAKLAVVTDTEIYGAGYRKAKARRNSGEKIAAFTDLKQGDYVVHEDHGVGIYHGTVRLESEGTYRDYLLIQYHGTDKLYVPVEQLARVQRYIGNPNALPKLNKLGGGDWQKQKSKVKAGLKQLAFDLVKLYAQRSQRTGYAFGKDTPWQREFEDQFPYELTPDQEQSVREITRDMESDRNMDRLLCGDVGYGKTEVSLRAAFKAVMDGKQVAILAPTTILAQQHYNTVLKRFHNFPVKADVISRFRSPREMKEVLSKVANGEIDLVVGTHRLLGKDVKFKNLGLLIVDEEQRFGVAHKEVIKNMKQQMDVLTLSATPIPRTLHMSMVGIRDMSVLETPPEERMPVQTHVVDYSDAVIRDAILRELSRGGQVYFLYNRVNSIDQFYSRLHQLVPEARIGVAHGQMKEHGLEDVMMDFYNGSYDVLLCTTIIESGLDVPTANTLIVFDAERFGLSQLYQLRGRVGRSNRQAYAYFTVRPDKMLSETAEQRLAAIREFTEFGAGFRIAMRDLEIRGAGNILGPEQHGHLATVGYDMYCKLIEETLHEVQGVSDGAKPLETRVDLKVDAFLPTDYVRDERQRMEMYKRIAAIQTQEDREDIEEELLDRFGETPAVVDALLDVSQLRALCNNVYITNVVYRKGALVMRVDNNCVTDPMLLMKALTQTDPRLSVQPGAVSAILLKDPKLLERDMLREGVKVMRRLNETMARLQEEAQNAG